MAGLAVGFTSSGPAMWIWNSQLEKREVPDERSGGTFT